MTLVRLSSIVTRNPKASSGTRTIPAFNGLEEQIFPDYKSEEIKSGFKYVFHSTPKVRDDLAIQLGYNLGDLIVGDYEYNLIQLLINSEEPIFCVSGHMGSGKTSAIRYIISILKGGSCTICSKQGECPHRKYMMMNFNQADYPSDERVAKAQLANDIYLKVKEALADTNTIEDKEEFSTFWNDMLNSLSKTNYEFRVFVHLRHIISEDYPDLVGNIGTIKDSEDIKIRRKIRKELLHDPEYGLEYYFHLWRYVLKNKFGNRNEHLILFFDNIDNSHPAVQTALVKLLSTYATNPGVRCVITVRPETFESANLNRASGFIRLESHEGPRPDRVICNDMNEFVDQTIFPDRLYPNKTKDFDFFRGYLGKILELNSDKTSNQYLTLNNFIHQACGPSIRLGIKLADGFLHVDDELLSAYESNSLTTFHIIRGLIKRGKLSFSVDNFGKNYHPIESIFDVPENNENGRILAKTRILTYLNNGKNNSVTLGELREVLGRFGYTETDLIRHSVNNLLQVQRQLIRSSSLDGYQTPEEFQGAGTSKISITEIGKGYLDLTGNIDFLQEVMLDCRINSNWDFPSHIEINSTHETLILIWRFLRILFTLDTEETRNFLYTPNGYDDYIENFGAQPLSWNIIKKTYSSARKIIYAGLRNRSISATTRDGYKDARGRFDQLLADLRTTTHNLLSIKLEMPEEYHLRDEE